MSLLTLLRFHGTAVIPPPTPPAEAPPILSGRHKAIPEPQLARFPAGRARILVNALVPNLLLLPEFGRARFVMHGKRPALAAEFESPSKKRQLIFRAIRDDREDEDFAHLAETAYLLTR